MTVYVDGARNEYRGMVMAHMLADDLLQLHEFASALGLKRRWFQPASFPHYDLSASKRTLAIALGARAVDRHELVAVMRRVREQPWYRDWVLGPPVTPTSGMKVPLEVVYPSAVHPDEDRQQQND